MAEILVPLGAMMMVVALALGIPLVRMMGKRIDRQAAMPAQIPDEVSARLERMEHAIDAVALEVERIAEGQRFTTKLLSERTDREPIRVGKGGPA